MTVDQLITLGLDVSHLNSSQVSAAKALVYLNAVYHDCVAGITQNVGEDFFLDVWVGDAVADQTNGEYSFPAGDGSVAGLRKLKQLDVKVNSDQTYFTKARQVDIRSLGEGWDWYLANQPSSEPIYFVADKSFFLAPNFTSDTAGAAGNGQLKLTGIKAVKDLAASGAETTILVPREFHANVFGPGLARWYYKHVGKDAEAETARQEYEAAKLAMYADLSDRDVSIGQTTMPDDYNLQ